MGLESCTLLSRLITEPHTRDFSLDDLIVLTAMTGDEYQATERLMTRHILPLIRQAGVRYVQIARAGQADEHRYDVLSDTRAPHTMVMAGAWRLSDELTAAGTVPMFASGHRLCSYRSKGQVLDWWVEDHLAGRPYRHMIGYNASETWRMSRDSSYTRLSRHPEYPLAQWGWTREDAGGYLHELFGEPFQRSCCAYCPFQAGKTGIADMLARWQAEPAAAAAALLLESRAMALNPLMSLFASKAAISIVREHRLRAVLDAYIDLQHTTAWSLYDVRRIHHARRDDPDRKGPVWRSVTQLETGSRLAMRRALARAAAGLRSDVVTDSYGIDRAVVIEPAPTYPSPTRMLAIGPAGALDKQRPAFTQKWEALFGRRVQAAL
jgi:hypothetical protein